MMALLTDSDINCRRIALDEEKLRLEQRKLSSDEKKIRFDQAVKVFEVFRDYIKHEDHLINQRTTWGYVTTGFLFAAYFNPSRHGGGIGHVSGDLIAIMGLLLAAATHLSVSAARFAIISLENRYKDFTEAETQEEAAPQRHLPGMTAGGSRAATSLGLFAGLAIPLLFVFVWTFLLILRTDWFERAVLDYSVVFFASLAITAAVGFLPTYVHQKNDRGL